MSYINVNTIYSFTNPFSSSNAGAITIPLSPIQHGPGCTAVGSGSHAEGRVTTASGDESQRVYKQSPMVFILTLRVFKQQQMVQLHMLRVSSLKQMVINLTQKVV